jgi:hypothetical protein
VTHGVSQSAHPFALPRYTERQDTVVFVTVSNFVTADWRATRPDPGKSGVRHSLREDPDVISEFDSGVVAVVVVVVVVVVESLPFDGVELCEGGAGFAASDWIASGIARKSEAATDRQPKTTAAFQLLAASSLFIKHCLCSMTHGGTRR